MEAEIKNLKKRIENTHNEHNEHKLNEDLNSIEKVTSDLENKLNGLLKNLDDILQEQSE